MKQSNLQFKESKTHFKTHKLAWVLILLSLLTCCRTPHHQLSEHRLNNGETPSTYLFKDPDKVTAGEWAVLFSDSCERFKTKPEEPFAVLRFRSDLGLTHALSLYKARDQLKMQIDTSDKILTSETLSPTDLEKLTELACLDTDNPMAFFKSSDIESWIFRDQLAPYTYCETFTFDGPMANCILPKAEDFATDLAQLKRKLLAGASTPPYALMRWISVSQMQLEKRPASFCDPALSPDNPSAASTHPLELPFVFHFAAIRPILCSAEDLPRGHLAYLALREVKFFSEVHQKKKLSGLIIPMADAQTMQDFDLEFKIIPSEASVKEWIADSVVENPVHRWHPLESKSNHYSKWLTMILGEGAVDMLAQDDQVDTAGAGLLNARFVAGVLSEQSFRVSPGYRKVLYLPKGEYKYESYLRHKAFFAAEDDSKLAKHGQFSWKNTGERVFIQF